jgi:hypothetical protein
MMTTYRAYLLNENRRIFFGEDIHAPSDTEAIASGYALLVSYNGSHPRAAHGFEIWTGRLCVFSA